MTVIDPITINNFEEHDTDTKCALLYVAVQELCDAIKEIKQYLDWDEISGEELTVVKNASIAENSKKIKHAADSANKNLDNALTVGVQSLKNIKAFYEESCADPHTFVNWGAVAQRLANEADDALTQISIILEITKGGKDD